MGILEQFRGILARKKGAGKLSTVTAGRQPAGDITTKYVPIVYGLQRLQATYVFAPSAGLRQVFHSPDHVTGNEQICQLALCEGPLSGAAFGIWIDDGYSATLDADTFPFVVSVGLLGRDVTLRDGSRLQAPWTFLGSGIVTKRALEAAVPSSSPYEIEVDDPDFATASYTSICVTTLGAVQPLVRTSGTPGDMRFNPDQSGGKIVFNAAQAGFGVKITYQVGVTKEGGSYGYGGTARLDTQGLWLGENISALPEVFVEIPGFLGTSDVNPADVLADLLTNDIYAGDIDPVLLSFTNGQDGTAASSLSTWCAQSGLLISCALIEPASLADWIDQILVSCDATLLWVDGVLKAFPYAEDDVGTFDSWQTPIYDVDEEDFLEPIVVRTEGYSTNPNEIPVQYTQRVTGDNAQYRICEIAAGEQMDIQNTGLRRSEVVETFLHSSTAAQKLSHILSRRSIHCAAEFELVLSAQYQMLMPMDILRVSDSRTGLTLRPVRIETMELDEDDRVHLTARAWLGIPHPTALDAPEAGDPQEQQVATLPATLIGGVFLRANPEAGTSEVLVGVSMLAPDTGANAEVWFSWNDSTFVLAGIVDQSATFGHVIGITLPVSPPSDETNTVQIDCEVSSGTIPDSSAEQRDGLETCLLVDDEIIAYSSSAAAAGLDHGYDVSSLLRGQLGTVAAAHVEGAQALLLDRNIVRIPVDKEHAGQTLYVRVLGANSAGITGQLIGDVASYEYTIPATLDGVAIISCPIVEEFNGLNLHDWRELSGAGVLSIQETGYAGGKCLRCTGGETTFVLETNVPYDPSKSYQLTTRYRQVTDPASGTKLFRAGLVGIEADGQAWLGKTGSSDQDLDDQYVGPSVSNAVSSDWSTYRYYWTGLATPGTDESAIILAPATLRTGVKYVRVWLTMNGGQAAGSACVQELDEIRLEELPDGQMIVPATLSADRVASPISLNLWPNANSEGTMPAGAVTACNGPNSGEVYDQHNAASEWGNLVSSGAYAGSKCRQITATSDHTYWYLSHWVRASPGQAYFLEAFAKRVSGGGYAGLNITAYDAAFTSLGGANSALTTSASYTRIYAQYTCPADTVWLKLSLVGNYVTSTTVVNFDSIQAYLDPGFYLASARISSDGSIYGQRGQFVLSCSRSATGQYDFVMDGYGATPLCVAPALVSFSNYCIRWMPNTTNQFSVYTFNPDTGVAVNSAFSVVVLW